MGYGYGYRFNYVSAAEKRRRAKKAEVGLRKEAAKSGRQLVPVILEGTKIAKTWWGKSWAQNLERYADYNNRIARGRSYVRNGAVLDLNIVPQTIEAKVAGSSRTPYTITIKIEPLATAVEQALMKKSRLSLDSLQQLITGEFPEALKKDFFAESKGLFPSPKAIKFSCSCPDSAYMCKHIAATLYGTAVRLDEKPELFFLLRGIKIETFVGDMIKSESKKLIKKSSQKSKRVIDVADDELSALFGVVLEQKVAIPKKSIRKNAVIKKKSVGKRSAPI